MLCTRAAVERRLTKIRLGSLKQNSARIYREIWLPSARRVGRGQRAYLTCSCPRVVRSSADDRAVMWFIVSPTFVQTEVLFRTSPDTQGPSAECSFLDQREKDWNQNHDVNG